MRLFSVLFLVSGAIALCAGCGTTAIDPGTDGGGGSGGSGGTDGGDPCGSLTCMNGGTCMEVDGGTAQCECATGYEGDECETDTDECPDDSLGPCDADNTASCDGTMPAGSYTCTCNDGYAGMDCEDDVDECPDDSLGPCDADNTASCDGTMPAGSYTCTCKPGYEGMDCETDTDECDGGLGPCNADNTVSCNGTSPPGSYTCTCETGWEGMDCDDDVDECDGGLGPCDSNGASACNGASPPGSYTCTCNTGYTGMDCDECAEGYIDDPGDPGTCILDPCPDGDPDSAQSYTPESTTPVGGVNPLEDIAKGLRISAIPQGASPAKIITSVSGFWGVNDPSQPANSQLQLAYNETADIAFFEDDEGTLTTARSATEIEITINTHPAPTSSIPIDISAFDTEGTQIGTTVSASYVASTIDVSALFSEAPIHRVRIAASTNPGFDVRVVAYTHECL